MLMISIIYEVYEIKTSTCEVEGGGVMFLNRTAIVPGGNDSLDPWPLFLCFKPTYLFLLKHIWKKAKNIFKKNKKNWDSHLVLSV